MPSIVDFGGGHDEFETDLVPLDALVIDNIPARAVVRSKKTRNLGLIPFQGKPMSTVLYEKDGRITLFNGISRYSPEGLAFKIRVEAVGWTKEIG